MWNICNYFYAAPPPYYHNICMQMQWRGDRLPDCLRISFHWHEKSQIFMLLQTAEMHLCFITPNILRTCYGLKWRSFSFLAVFWVFSTRISSWDNKQAKISTTIKAIQKNWWCSMSSGLHASKTNKGQAHTVKIQFIHNLKTKWNKKLENGLKVLKFMW